MSNKVHKHAAMIKAKADNMDLVVFRKNYDDEWMEMQNQCEIAIKQNGEYFACLPQHKEACLHWLNGGDAVVLHEKMGSLDIAEAGIIGWSCNSTFMKESAKIRIKPRKEKRWMGFNNRTNITTSTLYKSLDAVKNATVRHEEWQFIEIEVEL